MSEVVGRVGRSRKGEHASSYVAVERHSSGTGWHIWVMHADPRERPSGGWDIGADNEAQVQERLDINHLDVEWIA